MTLKLSELLFEEQNPKKLHRLFEEAEGEQDKNNQEKSEISDDIDSVGKKKIGLSTDKIAAKISSQIPKVDKLLSDEESLEGESGQNSLGIFTPSRIKTLVNSVTFQGGIKLNPFSVASETQQLGLDTTDIKFYKKLQIIPFYLYKEDESGEAKFVGGTKSGKEYEALVLMPAIGAVIDDKEALKYHTELFLGGQKLDVDDEKIEKIAKEKKKDPKEIKQGLGLVHAELSSLIHVMITPEERELVRTAFKNGDFKKLIPIAKKQTSRTTTESILDVDLNKLHENSLSSLLYQKKNIDVDQLDEGFFDIFGIGKTKATTTYVVGPGGSDVNMVTPDNVDVSNIGQGLQKAGILPSEGKGNNLGINKNLKDRARRNTYANLTSQAVNLLTRASFVQTKFGFPDKITGCKKHESYNLATYKEIVKVICKSDGSIDGNKMVSLFPKTEITGADLGMWNYVSGTLKTTDRPNYPAGKKYKLNISPLEKKQKYEIEGAFKKDLSTENNFEDFYRVHAEVKKVKMMYNPGSNPTQVKVDFKFTPFNKAITKPEIFSRLCGEDFFTKLDRLVKQFNKLTEGNELRQRQMKAANFFWIIRRNYGSADFYNDDYASVYLTLTGVSLKVDIPDVAANCFSPTTLKLTDDKLGDTDQDAAAVKEAIDYLDQYQTDENTNDDWKNFPIELTDDNSANSSCDAIADAIKDTIDGVATSGAGVFLDINSAELSSYADKIKKVLQKIRDDFSNATNKEEAEKLTNHYGQKGVELRNKILNIVKSVIRGDAQHDTLDGSLSAGEKDKVSKEDLTSALEKSLEKQFKTFNKILSSDLNVNSNMLGNEYLKNIKAAIKDGKSLNYDLDKLVDIDALESDISKKINVNRIIKLMMEDKADLTAKIEKLDPDTFEEDLGKILIEKITNAIEGILGRNSALLESNISNKNLLRESYYDAARTVMFGAAIASAVTSLVVTGGATAFVSPLLTSSLAGAGSLFNMLNTRKNNIDRKAAIAQKGKYAKNPDLFSEEIIQGAVPLIKQAVLGFINALHVSSFLALEKELKKEGISFTYSSESLTNVANGIKTRNSNLAKKENLNDTGKKLYSEIIDSFYAFKAANPIGKFVNVSSIENILIKTIYEGEARNPLAELMDFLQNEKKDLKDHFVYKSGLQSLILEDDGADSDDDESAEETSGNKIKKTFQINQLRDNLTKIMTKEVNTLNFQSDILAALNKELKKHEGEITGRKGFKSWATGKRNKKEVEKQLISVLHKVLKKVFGFSKSQVKQFVEDNDKMLSLIKDNKQIDNIDLMLEKNSIGLLLNEAISPANLDTVTQLKWSQSAQKFYASGTSSAQGVGARTWEIPGTANGQFKVGAQKGFIINKGGIPADAVDVTNPNIATNILTTSQGKYTGAAGPGSGSSAIPTTDGIEGFHVDVNKTVKKLIPDARPPQPVSFEQMVGSAATIVTLAAMAYSAYSWRRMNIEKAKIQNGQISQIFAETDWSGLFGIAVAEIVCRTLLANKDALAEQGIMITGSLPEVNVKSAEMDRVASDRLAARVKQNLTKAGKGKKFDSENITDAQISSVIRGDLTRLATAIIKIADPDRHENIINTADKNSLSSKRKGFLRLGGIFDFIKQRSDVEIADKLSGDQIQTARETQLQKSVASEVNALIDVILALVKDEKGLIEDGVILGRLTDLLFEAPSTGQNPSITADDLKQELMNTGVLIYNTELDEDSKAFVKAENRLIGTIGHMLKKLFNIEVTGLDQFEQLNLSKAAVEQSVNQKAPAGKPASKEIDEIVKGSGIPTSPTSPFDMNQMASVVNMMGGNPMMMFMMMMMNPQIMQQMMSLQKQGGTFADATKIVAQGDSKLSGFEKDFEESLKDQRQNLPLLNIKYAKALFKIYNKDLLKCGNIQKTNENIPRNNSKLFLESLKTKFRITKESTESISKDQYFVGRVANFIKTEMYVRVFKKDKSFFNKIIFEHILFSLTEDILEVGKNFTESNKNRNIKFIGKLSDKDFKLFNYYTVKEGSDADEVAANLKELGIDAVAAGDKINIDQDNIDKFKGEVEKVYNEADALVQEILREVLKESSNRYNKPVLRRKSVKKSRVINESEFLKKEFKRLWKL